MGNRHHPEVSRISIARCGGAVKVTPARTMVQSRGDAGDEHLTVTGELDHERDSLPPARFAEDHPANRKTGLDQTD
jgi:hypothetical protein